MEDDVRVRVEMSEVGEEVVDSREDEREQTTQTCHIKCQRMNDSGSGL
jgi:hypothetical protein